VKNETDAPLKAYLAERKRRVDEALDRCLPTEDFFPPVIFQAMRYSLFAGGKRLRPILCMAAAEAVGGEADPVLPAACALEMIHTYSLIHDDLPAMDDDDFRRGKPTCHKVFGENIAILAGDALLTEAFHLLAGRELAERIPDRAVVAAVRLVAEAAGFSGMVGGQVVDVLSEGKPADADTLQHIHSRKTGAMIIASVKLGAILAGAGEEQLAALASYGGRAGLAFQIADDILNVEGDRELLGKDTGSDACRRKMSYPALLGLDAAREKARELVDSAVEDLAGFDERADPLRKIARYILERKS
jgi:geranylgeranyl diphosphate synthase type II